MFGRLTPWKVISGTIRFLFLALIAAIVVFLGWRAVSHNTDPEEMMTLHADEALVEAYVEHGANLELYTQEQGTYPRAERNNGYFFIRQAVVIPEAEQIQILFADTHLLHCLVNLGNPQAAGTFQAIAFI